MKVLILTSSNPNKTAGIVAKDLLESLRRNREIEVKLIVREYDKYSDKDIISVNSKVDHFFIRVANYLNIFLRKFHLIKGNTAKTNTDYSIQVYDQSKKYYKIEKILKKVNFNPDAIIILFMQKFLNFQNLYELNKITGSIIYLYLMDMATFTGGCHYAWECKGYLENCGACPGIFSNDPFDQSNLNWHYKKKYIDKMPLEVIIGSEELNRQVLKASLLRGKKLHNNFYLPINEEIYKPIDKDIVRKELNLPPEKKIIFFGANSITNRRKGFKELITSLKILHSITSHNDRNHVHLLIAGHIDNRILNSIPFTFTSLGFLNSSDLPKAFQAADIFASPSIEDSGPMMVNQSLMCGTPVVSFEVGVAIDLVHNGITGYKAKLNDCQDFAGGLLSFLQLTDEQIKQINKNCRELALKKYSIGVVSEKWNNLLMIK